MAETSTGCMQPKDMNAKLSSKMGQHEEQRTAPDCVPRESNWSVTGRREAKIRGQALDSDN